MIQNISDKLDSLVQSLAAGQPRPAVTANAGGSHLSAPPPAPHAQNTVDARNPSITDAISRINQELSVSNPQVSLAVDKETNQVLIRYKDPNSGDVVRQIPSDAVLAMQKQLEKLKGTIFNSQG